jgi:hypothetical protein
MKPILPSCRERLSAEDFAFIAASLARDPRNAVGLAKLLTDPRARDAALETDRLFRALLEDPRTLPVSPQLYFYVLTRRALPRLERETADYIATVLVVFMEMRKLRTLPTHPESVVDYVSDMLAALAAASAAEEFHIRAHVGNYSMFMAGIFPAHLQHRASVRGAPGLSFYDELGSRSYRLASDHELAQQHALSPVYRAIADRFKEVRFSLNQMADRLLCIEPAVNPN